MVTETHVIAILVSLSLLLVTVQLVRRRRLREQHALLWLGASAAVFVLSVFGGIVTSVGTVFGVGYPPAVPLVFGLLFVLAILMSQNVVMSDTADKVRDLAQSISILEWQVRQAQSRGKIEAGDDGRNGDGDGGKVRVDPVAAEGTGHKTALRRVVIVGLDGATFDLIEPWTEDGQLPTLSRLMSEGAWGRMRSTTPPMTAPAWTSLATGANPGKHGLYDWVARRPGSYHFGPRTALDCRVPTIFNLLSQAGKRVCLLNVPMTYPPLPVNGVVVSGMPATNPRANISYPRSFYRRMVQAVGDYVLYPDPGQAYSDSGVDAFLKRLYRAGKARIRAFDYMRSREQWDLAMVVFNGTDTVSHAMWKHMDEQHPLHDPARRAKYGNAILDYYRYVDAYLAQLVADLPDDTTLLIVSDHGFGPFRKFIHVNNWLIESGLMKLKDTPRARLKYALHRLGITPMAVYDVMMRLGLGALKREVVRGQGRGLLSAFFLSFEDVDWERTTAYSLGNVGQININLLGREAQGSVQPGPEYERLRDEVISRLRELTDPEDGTAVVEAVHKREEIYSGSEMEAAPDIVFIPRGLEYFGFGEYEFGSNRIIEPVRHGISGTHRMDGVFLAYGAGIRPGVQLRGVGIVDVAPTVMALLGEPVPAHMDGRVLSEALSQEVGQAPTHLELVPWVAPVSDDHEQFTEEEERTLSERLRNLGYMG